MHSPERIMEALAWLYGVEWEQSGQAFSSDGRGDVWNDNGCWTWSNGDWGSNTGITAEVEHALAVTAPWEWKDGGEDVVFAFRGDDVMGHVQDNKARGASWRVSTDDGVTHSGSTPGVETAKSAARAAYLTWMRGRLALRGIEK